MVQNNHVWASKADPRQQTAVFDKATKVTTYYFDPGLRTGGLKSPGAGDEVLASEDPDAFESGVHSVITTLGTSPPGSF
jgi:hypothetical protein